MSINKKLYQEEIFETDSFEGSCYFPPVFSSTDDLFSDDVLEQYRTETAFKGDDSDMNRMDASGSLLGIGINPSTSQMEPTFENKGYVQSYLKSIIGRYIRCEFLLGTNLLTDKAGLLKDVGINYFVLIDASQDEIMCDLYSLKFVTTSSAVKPVPIQR
ncbi:MAG: hypothetical protein RR838_02085 [Clostridium sp.]